MLTLFCYVLFVCFCHGVYGGQQVTSPSTETILELNVDLILLRGLLRGSRGVQRLVLAVVGQKVVRGEVDVLGALEVALEVARAPDHHLVQGFRFVGFGLRG